MACETIGNENICKMVVGVEPVEDKIREKVVWTCLSLMR